jgi:hypothetical protein
MAYRRRSPEWTAEIRATVAACGSQKAAAEALNVARSTVCTVMKGAPPAPVFEMADVPSELPSADELLKRRAVQFARKRDAKEARHIIPVTVKIDGPIGLAVVGDPHVDDDGTDIELLQAHVKLLNQHPALLPLGIGDYSNNWVGRLARLYGQQSLGAAEAWVLVEWLIRAVPWLALISGNHDAWSGAGDPIQWMAKAARVTYESNGVRLGLILPSGRIIRVNARHDFKGHSQWNTAHGIAKAAQMGWRDHILTAGHTHVSGMQVVRDPMSGLISHCLRIGSYKRLDRYADELGLPNQTFTICPVVVVRPQFPDDDNRLLTTFFEPETAAEFLTWLRKRKSERAA